MCIAGKLLQQPSADLSSSSGRLAGQRIFGVIVQLADPIAVESRLIRFEIGAREQLRRKLLDGETHGFRGVGESPVSEGTSPRFPAPGGEELRFRSVIEGGHYRDPRSLHGEGTQAAPRPGHQTGNLDQIWRPLSRASTSR